MNRKVSSFTAAIAATAILAGSIGLFVGLLLNARVHPSEIELWQFAGSVLGAIVAIGGAASLYFFQGWHKDRQALNTVDHLLVEFETVARRGSEEALRGNLEHTRSALHEAADALASLRYAMRRVDRPSVRIAHLEHSLDILDIVEFRKTADALHTTGSLPQVADWISNLAEVALGLRKRMLEDPA